jgi:4-hydroxy-tetrahydrodipicolinate synthase
MRGVWTALVTPFTDQGEIDINSFREILRNQLEAGVAGVIPCGTTGESPTLSLKEKKTLIQTALEECKGTSTKVVAGAGSNDTQATVEFSKWASIQGVDGILVVTPYYNKPSQAGMELHYQTIADAVSCEVIPYNVPSRTGVSLTAETIFKLSKHPRIRSIKEATGNVAFASEIIDQGLSKGGPSLDILSGDDATYLPLLAVGAAGVISVASNLIPRVFVSIQKAMDLGQIREATKIHQEYYPVFRDLFVESNPVPIKFAMASMGWCTSRVRSPLAPLSESSRTQLEKTLTRCGITRGKTL